MIIEIKIIFNTRKLHIPFLIEFNINYILSDISLMNTKKLPLKHQIVSQLYR